MNPMVEITLASSAFVRTNANFALQKCLLGNPKPFLICTVPMQATRSFRTLLNVSIQTLSKNPSRFLVQASMA